MQTTRTYTHKTHGKIGQATLTAPDGEWTLDGKPIPESGVAHLLNFALQTLQDAYAGANSPVEAQGAFEKKRDAILNGTIGVRGGGSASDPVQDLAEKMARDQITMRFAAAAGLGKDGALPRMATIRDNLPKEALDKMARFGEFSGKSGNTFTWDSDAVAAYVEKQGLRDAAQKELAKRAKMVEQVDLDDLDI